MQPSTDAASVRVRADVLTLSAAHGGCSRVTRPKPNGPTSSSDAATRSARVPGDDPRRVQLATHVSSSIRASASAGSHAA